MRQIALVDMPENAAQFVQRVGRAVRFNGHAGLKPEKSNVRVRLYCATLPETAAEDANKSEASSADEEQVKLLKLDLDKYDKELQKL